jgi:hypothetical protein
VRISLRPLRAELIDIADNPLVAFCIIGGTYRKMLFPFAHIMPEDR